MKNLASASSNGRLLTDENEDEKSRLVISSLQAREEEIQRKKMEVREKVELQLGRAEEESRRLAQIWEVSIQLSSSRNLSTFDLSIQMVSEQAFHEN